MAATYTPIASITLGATASSVTFTNIPQTYTDLVLVGGSLFADSAHNLICQINNDTATNYSTTYLWGNGGSAASGRQSNQYGILVGGIASGVSSSEPATVISQFFNYSNTTTNKTLINRQNLASGSVDLTVGLWRSTSAITSIKLYIGFANNASPNGNFNANSTFNLYGILGANA